MRGRRGASWFDKPTTNGINFTTNGIRLTTNGVKFAVKGIRLLANVGRGSANGFDRLTRNGKLQGNVVGLATTAKRLARNGNRISRSGGGRRVRWQGQAWDGRGDRRGRWAVGTTG